MEPPHPALPSGPLEPVRVIVDQRRLGEGAGARFRVRLHGVEHDAFVVRWRGRLFAYVNACRHQRLNLDFGDARFFDEAFDALVCCHHGARYRPDTGACLEGPCEGGSLTPLRLEEREDGLWCVGPAGRAGGMSEGRDASAAPSGE